MSRPGRFLALGGFGLASALDAETTARAMYAGGFRHILSFEASEIPEASPIAGSQALPTVLMHGMGDFGDNPMGMRSFKEGIAKKTGSFALSVELCDDKDKFSGCDTEDQMNGFFMNMDDQVDQFARVVQSHDELKGGFNAIGLSQGNSVVRGYIHRYNNPPVKSFVSMHGTLMGVASIPKCPLTIPGIGLICKGVDALVSVGAYTGFVQKRLAQANYFRNPKSLDSFREDAIFLPYINNEVKGKENSTYADNFKSLEKLVMVMANGDTMIHPKESEHFGFFKDGSLDDLVAMKDAPWYTEDWFGLKSLDQAQKVDQYATEGDHLRFNSTFLYSMVSKYFIPSAQTEVQV